MTFTISFIIYTAAIIGVGLYSARFSRKTDEDYFLAGRTLGPWVASLSASASSMSGWVTMGLVGLAYKSGYQAYWLLPGCLLGFAFNWFVMAGPMRDRAEALGALTIPDFISMHFQERLPILRILSVIVIFVAMLLYVAAQFAAAGKAFDVAFNIEYAWGVMIGAAIVIVYTVIGGFRAACWTDFVQAFVMVGVLFLLPIWLLVENGGFEWVSSTLATVPDGNLDRFMPEGSFMALAGFLLGTGALGINFGYPGQPHILVRFMGMRDRRDVILGGIIGNIWAILLLWGAITIGIIVRVLFIEGEAWTVEAAATLTGDPETALVLSSMHLMHGVIGGMVMAAILAAIASTADSQLVVAASAAANDIYARLFDPDKKTSHMLINRVVVCTLGAGAALLVVFGPKQVYDFVVVYGWAVLGAAFGPQLILILLWRRASHAGCVAGMSVGFVIALVWPSIYKAELPDVEIYNLTLAFVVAFVVNVVVSLLKPSPPTQSEAAGDEV